MTKKKADSKSRDDPAVAHATIVVVAPVLSRTANKADAAIVAAMPFRIHFSRSFPIR